MKPVDIKKFLFSRLFFFILSTALQQAKLYGRMLSCYPGVMIIATPYFLVGLGVSIAQICSVIATIIPEIFFTTSDVVASYFVPVVMILARSCAAALSNPCVDFMVGAGKSAKVDVLFENAQSLIAATNTRLRKRVSRSLQ